MKIAFTRTGSESEDLKDVRIDLPSGYFNNPEAGTKCTDAQFNSDTCPASSKLGTSQVEVKAASLLNLTVDGTINFLTPRANEAATLGITMRPKKICILFVFCAQPGKMYLKTGVVIHAYGTEGNLRTSTNAAPSTSTVGIPILVWSANLSLDITVNKMTLNFQSRMNTNAAPNRFAMVATTSCLPAKSTATIVSQQNVVATANSTYTPTGCPSVPFNPTVDLSFGNTNSNAPSTTSFKLHVPQADATIQNAHPKIVDLDFPVGSGIELANLAGVDGCTETQLRADTCPAATVIGNAGSDAPYLPPALTGTVYAMNPITNAVPVGVVLRGARNTRIIFRGTLGIRGDVEGGQGRAYARFDAIPQLPYANVSVNITKLLYKNPRKAAYECGVQTSTHAITGYNGTVAQNGYGTVKTGTKTYQLQGCDVEPVTTITSGPSRPITTDNTPNFTFGSSIAGSTFKCSMDSETAYTSCPSPYTSPQLPDGAHTLYVKAVNGVAEDRTAEAYSFEINTGGDFVVTPSITTSTTVAGAHPDMTAEFDISGGQPRSLQIRMANGFAPSLNGRLVRCPAATAAIGGCDAPAYSGSAVGTVSMTANTGTGPVTGVGTIYLTDAPNVATDLGGVAVEIPFAGLGTFVAGAGAYIVENGKAGFIDIRDIPNTIGTTDITVSNLRFDFDGDTGRFLTNASSCTASAFSSNGTAWNGSPAASVVVPYGSTGCSTTTPPFNPTVAQRFNNSDAPLQASTPSVDSLASVVATVDVPADNATIRNMRVVEPPILGPNFNSFGQLEDKCSANAAINVAPVGQPVDYTFNPASCPAQSVVGSMEIHTPLLPDPIVGSVHLVEHSTLPWFGVKFDKPGVNIGLIGQTGLPTLAGCVPEEQETGVCPQTITVNFTRLPDIPLNKVVFSLNSPDRIGANGQTIQGKILKVGDQSDGACSPTNTASANLLSHSGTTVNLTQTINVNGCL